MTYYARDPLQDKDLMRALNQCSGTVVTDFGKSYKSVGDYIERAFDWLFENVLSWSPIEE